MTDRQPSLPARSLLLLAAALAAPTVLAGTERDELVKALRSPRAIKAETPLQAIENADPVDLMPGQELRGQLTWKDPIFERNDSAANIGPYRIHRFRAEAGRNYAIDVVCQSGGFGGKTIFLPDVYLLDDSGYIVARTPTRPQGIIEKGLPFRIGLSWEGTIPYTGGYNILVASDGRPLDEDALKATGVPDGTSSEKVRLSGEGKYLLSFRWIDKATNPVPSASKRVVKETGRTATRRETAVPPLPKLKTDNDGPVLRGAKDPPPADSLAKLDSITRADSLAKARAPQAPRKGKDAKPVAAAAGAKPAAPVQTPAPNEPIDSSLLIPADAPLPVLIALAGTRSAEELERAGLSARVHEALRRREEILRQAAKELRPLSVDSPSLARLVDSRILPDPPPPDSTPVDLKLSPKAPLVTVLRLARRASADQIFRAGLSKRVNEAFRQRAETVDRAAAILKPFDVRKNDLDTLIDRSLR